MSGSIGYPSPLIFGNRLPARLGRGRSILGYHKIGMAPARAVGRSNYILPVLLERQLKQMRHWGVMSRQLATQDGSEWEETPSFAVTFDDGYTSLYESGLEVLRNCRVRALTYLVADQLGGSNVWDQRNRDVALSLMSESHIRIWLQEGHEIGSHTLSHANLTSLPEEAARREVRESKDRLEQTFGIPVTHFCYPYGSWNRKVREWVQEAGYHTAVTVEQRQISPSDDRWSLPRWMVYTHPWPWLANLRERIRTKFRKV